MHVLVVQQYMIYYELFHTDEILIVTIIVHLFYIKLPPYNSIDGTDSTLLPSLDK